MFLSRRLSLLGLGVLTQFLLMTTLNTNANAAACNEACRHQRSLSQLTEVVLDHSKNGPQDLECAESGSRLSEAKLVLEGGVMSSKNLAEKILQNLQMHAGRLQTDQSQCGGTCQQTNVISQIVVSRPKTAGVNAKCSSYPDQLVKDEFDSEEEAASFVEETLRGNNRQGERLHAGCPDPCSFYVYNAATKKDDDRIQLNLMVRCGDPRGSLFSKYVFSGALVQEWTCQKPNL